MKLDILVQGDTNIFCGNFEKFHFLLISGASKFEFWQKYGYYWKLPKFHLNLQKYSYLEHSRRWNLAYWFILGWYKHFVWGFWRFLFFSDLWGFKVRILPYFEHFFKKIGNFCTKNLSSSPILLHLGYKSVSSIILWISWIWV